MKTILPSYLCLVTMLLAFSACHKTGDASDSGSSYVVNASFSVDSTVVLDHMVLYADNHVALREDSLSLTPNQTFSIELRTPGLDELYLCSDAGELCRFFAAGGQEVNLSLSGKADSVVVRFEPADSINSWLEEQKLAFENAKREEGRSLIDSLCHLHPTDVRCALLLREEVDALQDSIFVRRCLGALTPEAKPDWLVKSIDNLLFESASFLDRNRRLAVSKFQVNDSTVFDMGSTRSNYLLIYCWADYDSVSVDSLKSLAKLIKDEYDMKRLDLFTCCLGAADSASWQAAIKGIDGIHVWLPAGLADARVRNWFVDRVPTLFLCDMYNNQQQRNVWGKTLRNALGRLPNRSGFAHTPKKKPNGR